MAKRLGVLLTFRSGVDEAAVKAALQPLVETNLLEEDQIDNKDPAREWRRVPFVVHEFDDETGGPVWYEP